MSGPLRFTVLGMWTSSAYDDSSIYTTQNYHYRSYMDRSAECSDLFCSVFQGGTGVLKKFKIKYEIPHMKSTHNVEKLTCVTYLLEILESGSVLTSFFRQVVSIHRVFPDVAIGPRCTPHMLSVLQLFC